MLPPPGPRCCFRRRLLKAPILLSLFNRSREDQLVSFLDQPWSSVDLPVEVQNAMRFVVADLRRDFFFVHYSQPNTNSLLLRPDGSVSITSRPPTASIRISKSQYWDGVLYPSISLFAARASRSCFLTKPRFPHFDLTTSQVPSCGPVRRNLDFQILDTDRHSSIIL